MQSKKKIPSLVTNFPRFILVTMPDTVFCRHRSQCESYFAMPVSHNVEGM